MSCPNCCPDCLNATGGVCRKHAEPECTCYEMTGGHQPGCYFNRTTQPKEPTMTETNPTDSPTENPDPGNPDLVLKYQVDNLRAGLLDIEQKVRLLKEHPAIKQPETFPNQRGEMIAQSILAVRHIEDARMRLGKVLQYGRDGVSIFDRPEPQP